MGQRNIEEKGFPGNLDFLVLRHRIQGLHVVQAVGNFNQDHPDILRYGHQHFAEGERLPQIKITRQFCEPVNNPCHFLPKHVFNVGDGIFGIFHHIVQNCGTDGGGAQSQLTGNNVGHGNGV